MSYFTKEEMKMFVSLNGKKALFQDVIFTSTNGRVTVVKEDTSNYIHKYIRTQLNSICMALVGASIRKKKEDGRVNESSNQIAKRFVRALYKAGHEVLSDVTTGYPDIIVVINPYNIVVHIEIKSSADQDASKSSFRGFYVSGPLSKIAYDGLHFSIAFKVEQGYIESQQLTIAEDKQHRINDKESVWFIRSFKIDDLYDFELVAKSEFNAPMKHIYGATKCEMTQLF